MSNGATSPIDDLWWALMTTGCRELINVNKVPPTQHSGGSQGGGGDITGADETSGLWGHFLFFEFVFS